MRSSHANVNFKEELIETNRTGQTVVQSSYERSFNASNMVEVTNARRLGTRAGTNSQTPTPGMTAVGDSEYQQTEFTRG